MRRVPCSVDESVRYNLLIAAKLFVVERRSLFFHMYKPMNRETRFTPECRCEVKFILSTRSYISSRFIVLGEFFVKNSPEKQSRPFNDVRCLARFPANAGRSVTESEENLLYEMTRLMYHYAYLSVEYASRWHAVNSANIFFCQLCTTGGLRVCWCLCILMHYFACVRWFSERCNRVLQATRQLILGDKRAVLWLRKMEFPEVRLFLSFEKFNLIKHYHKKCMCM